MLRILLIISLIFYVLYKFGFFRAISQEAHRQRNFNRPPDGNVNVDSAPPKEKKRTDFRGGEYVDYEDVK